MRGAKQVIPGLRANLISPKETVYIGCLNVPWPEKERGGDLITWCDTGPNLVGVIGKWWKRPNSKLPKRALRLDQPCFWPLTVKSAMHSIHLSPPFFFHLHFLGVYYKWIQFITTSKHLIKVFFKYTSVFFPNLYFVLFCVVFASCHALCVASATQNDSDSFSHVLHQNLFPPNGTIFKKRMKNFEKIDRKTYTLLWWLQYWLCGLRFGEE